MYGNLQLLEGYGLAMPPGGMNREQARAYLRGLKKKCERLRRMARAAAKAGDRRRAAMYMAKFKKCVAFHKMMAAKLGLARPPGRKVGLRKMVPTAAEAVDGWGFYGDDGEDNDPADDFDPKSELEEKLTDIFKTGKSIYDFTQGSQIPIAGGRAGVFVTPGLDDDKNPTIKVGFGFKKSFSKAGDSDDRPGGGQVFRPTSRFPISPYIPRMPGRAIGFRTMVPRANEQSAGDRVPIPPQPLPPVTGPAGPRPIPIPGPADPGGSGDAGDKPSPKAGWGRMAPAPQIGMRSMVPAGAGPTVFDPRQEMIPQPMAARAPMGPTPFGPGATIYRPEMPGIKDPPDKFMGLGDLELALDGYGLFHPEIQGKKPTTMKLAYFAAIGGVLGHMTMGKTKKQKGRSALVGAGIGAFAAYLF